MPTLESAQVYPGTGMIEGTNLSEGRGTTRPFELVGTPYIKGWELAEALDPDRLARCLLSGSLFQSHFL